MKDIYIIAKARYDFNRSDKDWFTVMSYAKTLCEENKNG